MSNRNWGGHLPQSRQRRLLAASHLHLELIADAHRGTRRHIVESALVRCSVVQTDLADAENAAETIIRAAQEHSASAGHARLQIDILINNAGISKDRFLADLNRGSIDAEYFYESYNINVLGPLLLAQAAVPYLPTDRSGRIINISSVSSSLGLAGQSVYGGTKAALEAMTRSWSRGLADRATVNAVKPGPVITEVYFPGGRAGLEPDAGLPGQHAAGQDSRCRTGR